MIAKQKLSYKHFIFCQQSTIIGLYQQQKNKLYWIQDLQAGFVSAIIMLPQAVALAVVAGLTPESGIYTAAFPVVIASLLGSSGRLLSGPNTTMSIMIGAALAQLSTPNSNEYIQLGLILSAMIGLFQLILGTIGFGQLLTRIPQFVMHGLTMGVGGTLIASQLENISGLLENHVDGAWGHLWYASTAFDHINPYCVLVSITSLLSSAATRRYTSKRSLSLIIALAIGSIMALLLDILFGADITRIDRVGNLNIILLPLSMPAFNFNDWYVLQQLLQSALAIAIVGGLQSVVISHTFLGAPDTQNSVRRDLIAQGIANIFASISSGFAGSGSFNRTMAHVDAGARTAVSGVIAGIALLIMAWSTSGIIAYIAMPAMAATLVLIGSGLIRAAYIATNSRQKLVVVFIALVMISFGFVTATFAGLFFAIGRLAWQASKTHQVNFHKN